VRDGNSTKYSLGSAEGSVGHVGCRGGFGIGFVSFNFFEGAGHNGQQF